MTNDERNPNDEFRMTLSGKPRRASDSNTAASQQQFLNVVSRDEAARRFHEHLRLAPLGSETVPLDDALDRLLAADSVSDVDVPGFDRSNVDGFAVQAADTFEAMEERPRRLRLNREVLPPGVQPAKAVAPGTATAIATGAMLPRGADAVVMIEHTEAAETDGGTEIVVTRAVAPGENVSFAGGDIARGQCVLRAGQLLTSREIGVLAAIGTAEIEVFRRPRVAVISTGNEIVPPGGERPPGCVYDSNLAIISAAIRETGGEPVPLGVVADDEEQLTDFVQRALKFDAVVLSGGTSKGAGDLSYRVVSRLPNPGIVAHGVALKPGKPVCLAVTGGKPVAILPGFPTSAIFTFHEFVAPVLRAFAGRPRQARDSVTAILPLRINSERGRTEYMLVGLVSGAGGRGQESGVRSQGRIENRGSRIEDRDTASAGTAHPSSLIPDPSSGLSQTGSNSPLTTHPDAPPPCSSLVAYPMGKGSGSVTTFSLADGFITIDQHTEIVEAGSTVEVQLLSGRLQPADLVVIGSHCTGLDYLLGEMHRRGYTTKVMHVGSTGGLNAAKRGECDLAGIHLLDAASGQYNRPFLTERLALIPGYRRTQAFVFRPGDRRFEGKTAQEALAAALADPDCSMVNRNAGSGTRILIDRLIQESGARSQESGVRGQGSGVRSQRLEVRRQRSDDATPNGQRTTDNEPPTTHHPPLRPPGYAVQPTSHNAVAAAISQGRADWGVAIETVARAYGLACLPIQEEHYDFAVPRERLDRPAVRVFRELLGDAAVRQRVAEMGFDVDG